MRGHNICFYAELTKIIPNYHQILPLIKSSEYSDFFWHLFTTDAAVCAFAYNFFFQLSYFIQMTNLK